MKTTPHAALDALSKAAVANPIITGTTSTAGTASATSTASLKKFTIRIDADLLGRIRAAYLRDLAAGGEHRSLSAWAAAHLAAAVEEDEATHNHGRPYEPVAAGIVPQGPFQ